MQIYLENKEDCAYFLFFEPIEGPFICLPQDIPLSELLIFIQSSLDQMKPVILLKESCWQNEIDLFFLRSFHHKCFDNKFVYLNFSIRNSLSKFLAMNAQVKSFDEVQSFFIANL